MSETFKLFFYYVSLVLIKPRIATILYKLFFLKNMKHTLKITAILVLIFLAAQIIGLVIVQKSLNWEESSLSGEVILEESIAPRPEVQNKSLSWLHIFIAIIIGTLIALGLIEFNFLKIWKIWYWTAVTGCLSFAFYPFVLPVFFINPKILAFLLAVGFSTYKIMRPGVLIHNLTELFIYGGLASIFLNILNIFSVVIILISISVYDMYAVWKSKHMIKLAKFQAKSKIFTGFYIPYKKISSKQKKISRDKNKVRTAILGGGDIGFPLLFSGTVLASMAEQGIPPLTAFSEVLVIPVFTAIALFFLLAKGKKDKFYPAMPFLTVGCFVGYGVFLVINFLI